MAELSQLIRANDVAAVAAERDFLRASVKPWEDPSVPAAQTAKLLDRVLEAMAVAAGDRSKLWFISARVNADLPPYRQACGLPQPSAPPDQNVEMQIEERWEKDRDWAVAFFTDPEPAPGPTEGDVGDAVDEAFRIMGAVPAEPNPGAETAAAIDKATEILEHPERVQTTGAPKGKPIAASGFEVRDVWMPLTPDHRRLLGDKLADSVQREHELEDEAKTVAAGFKERVKKLRGEVDSLATALRENRIKTAVPCPIVVDGHWATVLHPVTREILERRAATDAERQSRLPGTGV